MKKSLLIIAVFTFMVSNIYAQENGPDTRSKIQLGVKLGFNYSNVYDTQGDGFTTDPKFGFVAGGFLAIPIGRFLGFQPELLYSQKGFKASGNFLGIGYEYTRTSNFIDVPLLIQLKPSKIVTLLVGPQFSYLMSEKDKFSNTTTEKDFKNSDLRRNVMCFVLGLDVCPNNLVIGARAGWDVQNNNGDGTSTVPRYKNVWYQVTMGFRF